MPWVVCPRVASAERFEFCTPAELGRLCLWRGDTEAGIEALDRALALGPESTGPDRAQLLCEIATAANALGQHHTAVAVLDRAVEELQDVGAPCGLSSKRARALAGLGRLEEARRLFEQALVQQRTAGDRVAAAGTRRDLGRLLVELGELEAGLEMLEAALRAEADLGREAPSTWTALALAHLRVGDLSGARGAAEAGWALARSGGRRGLEVEALRVLAAVQGALGAEGEALAALGEAAGIEGQLGLPSAIERLSNLTAALDNHALQREVGRLREAWGRQRWLLVGALLALLATALGLWAQRSRCAQLRRDLERSRAPAFDPQAPRDLIPLCSCCKSVRDEAGSWHSAEEFLVETTRSQLTHGLCPPCMEKLVATIP